VRTVDTIRLEPTIARQAHNVGPSSAARCWRLLARSDTVGGGSWGIVELDFDSVPTEDWSGGRPISSEPAAPNVPARAAFDGSPFTHWTSAEGPDDIPGASWIGYDFGPDHEVEVRSFSLRQWDGGARPNTIPVVKVQYSADGFVHDIRTADTVRTAQNTERNTYAVAPSAKARFWRLLADSTTGGGHWGVIDLRFSGYPPRAPSLSTTTMGGEERCSGGPIPTAQ